MSSGFLANLYELIAKDAMSAIVVFCDKGHTIFINDMAKQLLGAVTPELRDLFPGADHPQFKAFSGDLLKHEGLYQDILVKKSDGTFIARLGVRHLNIEDVKGTLLMIEDVTQQKKMQREITAKQNEIKASYEEMLKQNQQLKELDLAKNRFIALTTHELRTPLSAIYASAEILKLKLYDTPEEMNEFIDMIYEQGGHLQELVNDILDFAKIQANKMDFYIELQDAVPLIHGIVKNFEGMAESNSVSFEFNTPAGAMNCYFDEVRLRQVISNIVNNAIKYNREGGKVKVRFEESGDWLKVFVEDTGKGIPADQMDKVFNEFETIGQVAQHHKGTGLGMPISRKLTEGMGGKLLLSSEEGVGSVFWIEIPKTKILSEDVYRVRPEKKGGDFAA